jgi:uncharacterized protein YjbI with pentapeptide repeats
MKVENKSGLPPVENELWLPPLSRKTEEALACLRKSKDKIKHTKHTRLKGKDLWNWLPFILVIICILAFMGSVFLGLSRFTTQTVREQQTQKLLSQQQIQTQKLLSQQQIQTQKLLSQQQIQTQKLLSQQQLQFLAKHLSTNLTPLIKLLESVVDQQHAQALTSYLDYISTLLLSQSSSLLRSKKGSLERALAQTRTLMILTDLSTDSLRKSIVIQFLHDTGLIQAHSTTGPVIQLTRVNLSGINLKQANLTATDFDGVILTGANLDATILMKSSFRGATLTNVNFSRANLENVDFSSANLQNADFTGAAMKGANLSGAKWQHLSEHRF